MEYIKENSPEIAHLYDKFNNFKAFSEHKLEYKTNSKGQVLNGRRKIKHFVKALLSHPEWFPVCRSREGVVKPTAVRHNNTFRSP